MEKEKLSDSDQLYIELIRMLDEGKINEAENRLYEELDPARLPMLELALAGFQPDILDSYHVTYKCDCGLERVEKMIHSLGKKEVERMRDEDPIAEVNCQFCNKNYKVDLNELLKNWPAIDEKHADENA